MTLVYPKEPTLARIAILFSALFWVAVIVGTAGIALLFLAFGFVGYLFAQSGFISYVRGNGVRVSREQLPDLHQRYVECCKRIRVEPVPEMYVLNANGILNALATRFLRRHYVIVFSDVLDALAGHPDSIDFYLGHELGHIHRRHLRWAAFVWPASLLPLLGTAYARAREYTCDLYGLACCDGPKDAAYGLAVLAAGARSWEQIDLHRFAQQSGDTGGFWMSYHELTADYPWLTKRMAHVMAASGEPGARANADFPSRHLLAWVLAFFMPRTGMGAGGGLAGMMAMVAMLGIVSAIAIPNFLKFQMRSKVAQARTVREQVQAAGTAYIEQNQTMPPSLSAMGLPDELANAAVAGVAVEDQSIVIHLRPELEAAIGGTQVVLTPYMDQGRLVWDCGGTLGAEFLSQACSDAPAPSSDLAGLMQTATSEGEEAATAETAATGSLEASEQTCSAGFRDAPAYQALGAEARDALRRACNAWKLEQLGTQMDAGR